MSAIGIYLTELVVTMGIVCAALMCLWKPLFAVLNDLSGSNERARFWAFFCNAVLFLVPLALALGAHPSAQSLPAAVSEIGDELESAIIGFSITVVVLGWMLTRVNRLQPAKRNDAR